MKPTDNDVDAYIDTIDHATRKADARTLCALMAEVTGEPAVLWEANIVGFGAYHYRYVSGFEGDAPLASFAPRKPHTVVYLVGEFEDRHARTLEELGPHKTGKGCLYLKRLDDVDLDVLRALIDRSVRVRRGVDRQSTADTEPS